MRFGDGFSLGERPEIRALLTDAVPLSDTPGLTRHFLFLDDPDRSTPDSLTVIGANSRLDTRARLRAALILAEPEVTGLPEDLPVMRVRDARASVTALIRAFDARIHRDIPFAAGDDNIVHPTAVIEGVLEGGVTVGARACVAAGSFVGRGSRIGAGAVIEAHCVIGPRAVIQAGAVIGCAGFGFFGGAGSLEAVPHEAGVTLGADVFIGANTVVAAGVLHPTEIGDGCKLDSHVQIAHNVRLGANSLMASQSGIAGSTVVGEGLRMGGAASISGHLRLGRGVSVAAKSGVTKDIPDNAVVAGFPARPIAEWRRAQIRMMKDESGKRKK